MFQALDYNRLMNFTRVQEPEDDTMVILYSALSASTSFGVSKTQNFICALFSLSQLAANACAFSIDFQASEGVN